MKRLFLLLVITLSSHPALAQPRFTMFQASIPATSFNGKIAQVNLSFNANGYTFINEVSDCVDWVYGDNTAHPDVSVMNAYGFPAGSAGNTNLTAHSGWRTSCTLPSSVEVPGNYIVDWIGGANTKINVPGSIVSVSGSGCTQSGNDVTGANCTVTTTVSSGQSWGVDQVDTTTPLTQLRFYNSSFATQVAALPTCISTKGIAQCGQYIFQPQFLSTLANFGSIRHLNSAQYNVTNIATWEDRTPTTWWSYTADYYPQALVTSNKITAGTGTGCTSSASCYTLAFSGFTLTDKAHFIAQANATINPPSLVTNNSSSSGSSVLNFASVPASIQAGMLVADATTFNNIQPTAKVLSTTSTTVTLNTVLFGNVNGGDTIYFSPMLNVNGTGYMPLAWLAGDVFVFGNILYAINYMTGTYDAALGVFMMAANEFENAGLGNANGGWPPEIQAALSNVVGAHLWEPLPAYSIDPPTDYVSSVSAYMAANLNPGLKFIAETCTNENWNTVFFGTLYGENKEFLRTATNYDYNNWCGRSNSINGQTVKNTFGGNTARYEVVAGMSTFAGSIPTKGGGNQDNKLASPEYVSNGGFPAYQVVTHIAIANYWNSGYHWSNSELGWAYWYTNGGTAATLIGDYLAGATLACSSGCYSPYTLPLANTQYQGFASYLASYSGTATIGMTAYEGGDVECFANNSACGGYPLQTVSITAFTPGSPTVLTIGANAYNYICNTASLCTAGAPTGAITGTGCAALDGKDPAITAATSTTITVGLNSTGCTSSSTGAIAYDNVETYVTAFELAAMQSSQLTPYELTNLRNFYTAGGIFPSEFDLADNGPWGKYNPDVWQTAIPVIVAVQQYQTSP